jgi:hypothetical protein
LTANESPADGIKTTKRSKYSSPLVVTLKIESKTSLNQILGGLNDWSRQKYRDAPHISGRTGCLVGLKILKSWEIFRLYVGLEMFIRVKVIGKKNYYYLVASKRVDGKIKQKVVRYLGVSKPSPKVIADVIAAVQSKG